MEDTIEIKAPEVDENLLEKQEPQLLEKLRVKPKNQSTTENINICNLNIDEKRILSERTFSNDNVSFGLENSTRQVSSIVDPIVRSTNSINNISLQCSAPFHSSDLTKVETEHHVENSLTIIRKPLAEISLTHARKTPFRIKPSVQKELVLDEILDKENIPAPKLCSTPEEDKIIVYPPEKHLEKLYDGNGLRPNVSIKEFYDLLFDYRCLWQEVERLQILKNVNMKNGSRD